MSIETTFERIANALESLAKSNQALLDLQSGKAGPKTAAEAAAQSAQAATPAPEPAPSSPAETAAPAPTATTPSAAPAPAPTAASETITMESLNQLCSAKAEKLGDAGPIFALFQEFGANSIPELKPEDYAAFKAKVESL